MQLYKVTICRGWLTVPEMALLVHLKIVFVLSVTAVSLIGIYLLHTDI